MELLQEQMRHLTGMVQQQAQQIAAAEQRAASAEAALAAGQQGLTPLALQQLVRALNAQRPGPERKPLIDVRGLGKPTVFSNTEVDIVPWVRKFAYYVAGVYPEARKILNASAEAEDPEPIDEGAKTTRKDGLHFSSGLLESMRDVTVEC